MARKRTIILLKTTEPAAGGGGRTEMVPLGTAREIIGTLFNFNVSGDGSGPNGWGTDPVIATLYGPGFILEVPAGNNGKDEQSQVMVSVTDDDFAWPVLTRLCKEQKWKMMDPESGRTFG